PATASAAPPTPAARNERRQVTVLHAGITLDSELDPEALHRELARFSDRFAAIVERHGGTVERSSAESAVGFFGLATTHEDDVLRALRAALALGVTAGIDSGELFVGEEFASGRPVSRARRLHETVSDGVGIPHGPVRELVGQLGGPPRVAELLAGDPQAAQRVLGALGESDEPGQAEEILRGFRRLLEEAAREQPLVVAVEDVHWAEP